MEKRILNVACGDDTQGTDFVDIYPTRPEVKKCDIDNEPLPYEDETFDEVYCKASLHHFRNPGNALKEMHRVLKKAGKLFIITDNAGCIFYHIRKTTHYGTYEKVREAKPEDKQYELFTPWHLINHFQAIGLEMEKIEYYINEPAMKNNFHKFIYRLFGFIFGKGIGYPQISAIGKK